MGMHYVGIRNMYCDRPRRDRRELKSQELVNRGACTISKAALSAAGDPCLGRRPALRNATLVGHL